MAAAATPEYGKSISKVEGTFEGRVISRHSFLGVGQFSRFPEFLVLLSEEGRILAITRCLTRPGPCTKTRHKRKIQRYQNQPLFPVPIYRRRRNNGTRSCYAVCRVVGRAIISSLGRPFYITSRDHWKCPSGEKQ